MILALSTAIATGAPAPTPAAPAARAATLTRRAQNTLAADAQLITALRAQIGAAKQLERATLAAVEQRLRAIYALPGETPLTALLTGDVAQAEAMAELTSAMARSDDVLLTNYTNSLANLQTAQAELAQNALRIDAQLRIAAAERAATHLPGHARGAGSATSASATLPTTSSGTAGLPGTVLANHTLPELAPLNPVTSRPIVASN